MHNPTDRIAHTTAFVTPVMEHWLEREIAQWLHPMKDRSNDPSHHELTLLPQSYISLPVSWVQCVSVCMCVCVCVWWWERFTDINVIKRQYFKMLHFTMCNCWEAIQISVSSPFLSLFLSLPSSPFIYIY